MNDPKLCRRRVYVSGGIENDHQWHEKSIEHLQSILKRFYINISCKRFILNEFAEINTKNIHF